MKMDTKIICDNCKWEWKLSEGGNDPYICHKCGHNNTKKNKNIKVRITEEQFNRLIIKTQLKKI